MVLKLKSKYEVVTLYCHEQLDWIENTEEVKYHNLKNVYTTKGG
ncbi:hypothetical protein [Staphylococcus equorum]|nr:hypothetical protein [Staphylococcus equorum]